MCSTFPTQDQLAYRLLELTAICGEFPAYLLSRLPESSSYLDTVIRQLKKDKLLLVYYRDKLRGYRLTTKAKAFLLAENPERFSFYLTGNADTNLVKSEPARRMRLHRLAEVYVLMRNCGVDIFRDRKEAIFSPDGYGGSHILTPAFYGSREVKEIGVEAVKIRGSRMMGVLLTPSSVSVVYNGALNFTKWDYRAEQRARALLKSILCCDRLSSQYRQEQVCGLLVGRDMEPLYELLSSADTNTRCFFLLDGGYEHFYFLSNDHRGEMLLRLLCSWELRSWLDGILSQDLLPQKPGLPIEHDAVTASGEPVLFAYLPDIPRLARFGSALERLGRTGTLICFDFQQEIFARCFGTHTHIQTISFEKFEGSFLNRQK